MPVSRSQNVAVPRRWRRWTALPVWLRFVLLGVAGYVAYVGLGWMLQEQFLFPGARRAPALDAERRWPEVERVWITTDDGARVEAWHQAGDGRSAASPGPAVMYFHANGDLLEEGWPAMLWYLERGFSALAVEYRGYGRSSGSPSQAGIVADCVRFRDWLNARPETDASRILYHGISLGGGVACALGAERSPAALVLECTFSSVEDLAREKLLPPQLCRHPFRSREALSRLDVPTLIMHGTRDEVIPFEHGQRLHAARLGSRFVELQCGHHDYRSDLRALRDFVDALRWGASGE